VTAVASNAAEVLPGSSEDGSHQGLPRWIPIAVTLVSGFLFFALTTHGTFNPANELPQAGFADGFYVAQAHSLVHGYLYVPPADLPGECFVYQGRCYGYFGLTPSLIRLPFLPLLNAANSSFTPLFLTLALVVAVGPALAIASQVLAKVKRTRLFFCLGAALALSLGPASVLMMVARPAVYEEAIAWAVAFSLLGIYCFLRWWSTPTKVWGVLVVLTLVLATNSRPTALPVGVALGAGIAVRAVLRRRATGWDWRVLLFAATVAIVPVVAGLGAFWLKFGTPFPSLLLNQEMSGPGAEPWWLAILHIDHGNIDSLRFLPTTLFAYLRPDGIVFTHRFPWVNLRFGSVAGIRYIGIPRGGIFVQVFSTLTDDMPMFIAIVIATFVYGVSELRRPAIRLRNLIGGWLLSPMTYCILGTGASCIIMMSNAFITNRYLGDLFPFVVVTMVTSVRFLARPAGLLSGRNALIVTGGVIVVLAWSLLVDIGLEYQSWWFTTP
jgi:hypothetical protein